MSPRESDLRAALRHGEGDGLDPSIVIQRAEHARRHRRRTIAAVGGGVLAVAAVVAVVPVLASINGSSGASSAMTGAVAATSGAGGAAGATGTGKVHAPLLPERSATRSGVATVLSCPDVAPPAGAPGSASSSAPVFPEPVTRILVCIFQQPAHLGVASTELAQSYSLSGAEAQAVANRLSAIAPAANGSGSACPYAPAPTIVLIAESGTGLTTEAVGSLNCDGMIGSASGWRNARDVLMALTNRSATQQGNAPPRDSHGPGPS